MRTITTAQRNQIKAGTLAIFTRLELQNPDLVWKDVSTALSTPDWFNEATLTESIDQVSQSFTAILLRDTGSLSLAPLRTDSTINRNGVGSYAPMLDVKRQWRASIAVVATGTVPVTADWKEVGIGYIDTIDVQGSPSTITVTGRDLLARILDHYMRGVDGLQVFPTYSPTSADSMETVIQQVLDDELGTGRANVGSSGITLYTPVSPSYVMEPYNTGAGGLMDALTAIAQLAGMVIRYRYDASDVSRLTLLTPPRTASTADWTIGPDEYSVIPINKLDVTGVRTLIDLFYIDTDLGGPAQATSPKALLGTLTATSGAATFSVSQAGVVANGALILVAGMKCRVSAFNGTTGCTLSGTPTFAASPWTTSDGLTKYDLRYMKVDAQQASLIMTTVNAQAMVDAIRSDLETPWLEQQFTSYALWFAQLYDYAKTLANGVQYNADQTGGVTSITHRLKGGTVKTDIGARGQPSGGYRLWLQTGIASQASSSTGPNLTVTPTPGVSTYSIAWSGDNVTLSIDGAAYGTPGTSPISVARTSSDHTYAFSGVANGQTVTDSVTIPAVASTGVNTVTPDLTVTPGTQTSTTEPFTATGSNPSGGTAPTIKVTIHGTTGSGSSVGAIAADTQTTIPSGEVVTVNRPAFNSVPASVSFIADLGAGNGTEFIGRSILNQDKTSFGPNLSVVVTPGTTSYSIAWSGDGVTLQIDGGSVITEPTSPLDATPIVVPRNTAGGADKVYSFHGTKDSQAVSNTVNIPAQTVDLSNVFINITPSATAYVFTWTATGVTASVSGGTVTARTSGFSVSRNASGGVDVPVVFYVPQGANTISTTITVPAQSGSTAPSASLVASLTNNQLNDTTNPVTLTASATNLPAAYTWAIFEGYSKGQYSSTPTWSGSNSSNPLTKTESVTVSLKNSQWFQLVITVGSDTYVAESQVQGLLAFINSSGSPVSGTAWSDGGGVTRTSDPAGYDINSGVSVSTGTSVNRMFAKPLFSSPDTGNSIPDGTTNRVPTLNEATGGGRGYTGLNSSGVVQVDVPLSHSVANVPAISGSSGKLLPGIALDGTTGTPVHTQLNVSSLLNGATVTTGASYGAGGFTNASGALVSGAVDSGARSVNKMFAKPLSGNPDTFSSVPDDASYAKTIASRVSSGKPFIDFSESINVNKTADYIGDGATYGITTKTDRTNLVATVDASGVKSGKMIRGRTFDDGAYAVQSGNSNGLLIASGVTDSGARAVNKFYAKPLAANPDTGDSIADGASYGITTFNQRTGGGRGYSALDSSNSLVTSVANQATLGGKYARDIAQLTGTTLFSENWDTFDASNGAWAISTAGSISHRLADTSYAHKGADTINFNVYEVFEGRSLIALDPTKLYRVRIGLQAANDSSPGTQYCGIIALLADGTGANSNSGYCYLVLSARSIATAAGYQVYEGWFKAGAGSYSAAYSTEAPNATSPMLLPTGSTQFLPYVLINYTSGTQNFLWDFIDVTEYDEDASNRIYTLADINGRVSDPTKLNPVSSSGTRFWLTHPGLTASGYVPLSSSGYVIDVLNFDLHIGSQTIAYTASVGITVPTYDTYYIYVDDPTYTGGGTYIATTNSADTARNTGRIYVGTITTNSGSGTGGKGPAPF